MLTRTATLTLAALVALLLGATLLRGGGSAPHVVGTEATPTVPIAGLPESLRPAASAEIADLDRLAGTMLALLLLGTATVLVTLLGVMAAENLAGQGRRLIEVMLGAPPRWLVGGAARRWLRRIGVAVGLGGAGVGLAAVFLVLDAPPGTHFARPAPLWSVVAVAAVAGLVLLVATLPVAGLYRREPLGQHAESSHSTDPRPRQFARVALMTLQLCVSSAILAGAGLLILGGERGDAAGTGLREAGVELVLATLVPMEGAPAEGAQADGDGPDRSLESAHPGDLYAAALAAIGEAPGLAAESLATPGAWIGRGPEATSLNECGACSAGGMPNPFHTTRVRVHAVMPGFFAARGLPFAAGQPFVAGEGFAEREPVAPNGGEAISPGEPSSPPRGQDLEGGDRESPIAGPVVINEAYARAHFLDPPVLGRELSVAGPTGPWYEVAGVVRDGSARGLGASSSPYSVYFPADRHPPAAAELVVAVGSAVRDLDGQAGERRRPGADAAPFAPVAAAPNGAIKGGEGNRVEWAAAAITAALGGAVPALAVEDVRPAGHESRRLLGTAPWLGRGTRNAGLLAAATALAGIVGAMRAHVRSRRRELGIRAALGAAPRKLRRMILGEALRIGATGAGAGLWGAALVVGALGPPGVGIFSAPLALATGLVFVAATAMAALPGSRTAAAADPREAMEG